ncbi:MAG: zf-TFIIB domain-containing protein [Pseudomonadota bacterium]
MQCPIDGTQLVMADRSGVEIDYCPSCRGVWLDRGELDKIIERSASAYTAPPPPPPPQATQGYQQVHRDEYDDDRQSTRARRRKKRENPVTDLLGDIFDF